MVFRGVARVFDTKNDKQYEAIGAFWDELSSVYGRKNLRGLGYNWHEDSFEYILGFTPEYEAYVEKMSSRKVRDTAIERLMLEAVELCKSRFGEDCVIRSVGIPELGWTTYETTVDSLSSTYSEIWASSSIPLTFEIEEFDDEGHARISVNRQTTGRVNVVLFEPEIPQNAGNIMRTCVATNCRLHIIKPCGFDIEGQKFRRFTTNHISSAQFYIHESWEDFVSKQHIGTKADSFFLTRYGRVPHSSIDFAGVPLDHDIYIVFGRESTGVPLDILKANIDNCFRIPMHADCRSLNVSNAAAITIYECMRQLSYIGLSLTEVQKGEDFLESYDIGRE